MTDLLRNALHEAADEYPPIELGDDPWRRGRRARRRRRVGAAAGMAAAGALIVGLGLGGVPDLSMGPQPAAPASEDAMLPDQLFAVPANLPDVSDDPLDGPASLVYTGPPVRIGLFDGTASVPIVVGADWDVVRAVRSSGFVDQVELSPDGTRLALAKGWSPDSNEAQPSPVGITVLDLRSGVENRFVLPFGDALGGGIERMVWAPDSEAVAVTAIRTTEVTENGGYSGDERYFTLDLATGLGERTHPGPRAFSPDGMYELREDGEAGGEGLVIAEIDGPVITDLAADWTQWGAAFAPDGQSVAMVRADAPGGAYGPTNPFEVEIFHATTGEQVASVELGEYARAQLLGWGQRGLVVEIHDVERGMWLERLTVSESGALSRDVALESADDAPVNSVSVARDYFDADVRNAERPNAPFDWVPWLPLFGVAGIVALVLGWRQRRQGAKIRPVGSDEPAESDTGLHPGA